MRAITKAVLSLLLTSGVATAGIAASTQPAQAAVVVSGGIGVSFGTGFGGGYARGYHWHRWHDGYGWHRRWVPFGWVAPVGYGPAPAYAHPVSYYPVRAVYARPY